MGARAALGALAGAAVLALAPSTAGASGWGRPFRLTQPYATDLTPVTLTMSSRGNAAVAFSVQDEDNPASSAPFLAIRAAAGSVSAPFAVPDAQLVLDLAYDAGGLRLLTGTSEAGQTCCSTVQTVSLGHDGRFGRASTVVGRLAGMTLGSLTPLPSGKLLATVATDRGVWVAQSRLGAGFGPARRVTSAAAMPWTVAAAADARGETMVAWTETKGQQGEVAPTKVYVATGSERAAPGHARPALSAASGHSIDELGLAPASGAVTLAWIESWFDRRGSYHAQMMVSDLAPGARRRAFPVGGQTASGLSAAGDFAGDQVVTWKSCSALGACAVRAAVRRPGRGFGPSQQLGSIDPGQSPVAAVSRSGDTLVGWIGSGHVLAAESRPGAARMGAARTVSDTSFAANLALSFGAARNAMAAWTQGTLNPDVVGAVFRP